MNKLSLTLLILLIPVFLFAQEIGKEPPAFSGKTANGEKVSLSDYKGKVTIIDFWASWCKPCKEGFPFLVELYDNYSDKGFEVLGVNLDEEVANMNKFLRKMDKDIKFKIISDADSKIGNLYNVEAIPSTFFIDKKGVLRYMHLGFSGDDKEKFKKEIESLLNE
jgi:peroxiredoxin